MDEVKLCNMPKGLINDQNLPLIIGCKQKSFYFMLFRKDSFNKENVNFNNFVVSGQRKKTFP